MARDYAPEVKAQVMAALLAGQSQAAIAKQFGIPKGTIAAWKARKTDPVIAAIASGATQKKQDEINDLVLDLLIAQLRSQIAMAEHAGDKKWLTIQDASAVAMLLGVENDKVFRLLQALEDAGNKSESTEG